MNPSIPKKPIVSTTNLIINKKAEEAPSTNEKNPKASQEEYKAHASKGVRGSSVEQMRPSKIWRKCSK